MRRSAALLQRLIAFFSDAFRSEPITTPLLVAAVPPILACLLLLVILPWIVRGFRNKE
jgi:hypothetical protein